MKNFLTILFIIILSLLFLHPVSGDGDFFHHLATGRYVVNNHVLPRVDEWTFTANGLPWIAYSWGMGVIFYLIYNTFGPAGISIFVAVTGFITLSLLSSLLSSLGVTRKITLVILPLAATAIATRFPSRPEIVTYPLTLMLLLIDRYKDKFPKLVILMPVVTLVWANFYGASVLWAIVLTILLICRAFVNPGFKFKKNTLSFYFFCILAILVSFANGYGARSVFYLKYIEKIGPMQSEWMGLVDILRSAPSELLLSYQYLILIYFLFLSAFIVVCIFSGRKIIRYPFLALLAGGLVLPFVVFRYVPLAVILSAPLLGALIASQPKWRSRILSFLLILGGVVSIVISLNINPVGISRRNDNFPSEVVEFMQNHDISGRAYNNQRIGAFLSYYLYPKVLIFVDTRDELYLPTGVFGDYMKVFSTGTSVIPLLEKYKSDLVIGDYLTEGRSYGPLFYSTYWAIVYINDRYFIAIPRMVAKDKNLTIFDAVDPFSLNGGKPGAEEKAQKEYEKAFAGSDSLQNQIIMIKMMIAQKKYEQAFEKTKDLQSSGFIDNLITKITKDQILAQLYMETKDCQNTKKYLLKLDSDASRKYIFAPGKKLPSDSNSGFAFYYLICEKDYTRAQYYLDLYLSSPYITQLERIKIMDRFQRLRL